MLEWLFHPLVRVLDYVLLVFRVRDDRRRRREDAERRTLQDIARVNAWLRTQGATGDNGPHDAGTAPREEQRT